MQELQTLIEPKSAPAAGREVITSGWHIVLCEPARELVAVSGMTARGFEASCPCEYIRRRTGRLDVTGRMILSKEPTPKAMIPGYVFVRFEPNNLDYDGVKKAPGVRGFYRLTTRDDRKPRYAGLNDKEMDDLRLADRIAFEQFQQSVMPKAKQKPAVEFQPGKEVRCFVTEFGREIAGSMQEKLGGGMVRIVNRFASFIVPHSDIMELAS